MCRGGGKSPDHKWWNERRWSGATGREGTRWGEEPLVWMGIKKERDQRRHWVGADWQSLGGRPRTVWPRREMPTYPLGPGPLDARDRWRSKTICPTSLWQRDNQCMWGHRPSLRSDRRTEAECEGQIRTGRGLTSRNDAVVVWLGPLREGRTQSNFLGAWDRMVSQSHRLIKSIWQGDQEPTPSTPQKMTVVTAEQLYDCYGLLTSL